MNSNLTLNPKPTKLVFFARLMGSFFLSIFILNIFIMFYKYNGARILNEDLTTDYKWSSNQLFTNMAEGFSFFYFDKYGFNNIEDKNNKKVDILLMGSSHMEAYNVNSKENTGYLLNYLLPNLKTYNIGISSHDFLVCLRNLLTAYNYYQPKIIVIETMDLIFSLSNMNSLINGTLKRNRAYKAKSSSVFIQKCFPSIKWIINQISAWEKQSKSIFDKKSIIETQMDNSVEYEELLNKVIKQAIKNVNNCKIIIFYHPPTRLNNEGNIVFEKDNKYLSIFEKVCKNNNIIFLDTDKDFIELYKISHILPYGFINTAVGSGHLNKFGHEVIAKRLAKEISILEERRK